MGTESRRARRGPVYDDAMKILAADDLDAVLSLVGEHGSGARPLNVELLRSPTTAALAALAAGAPEERVETLVAAAALIGRSDPDRSRSLLAAAVTLGSIVLPRSIIDTALKEAAMPVLIRDTPYGRELVEEARQHGLQEGLQEGREEGRVEGARQAVERLTVLMLRRRFGDDPRIETLAAVLAELPDEDRLARLADAAALDDLTS